MEDSPEEQEGFVTLEQGTLEVRNLSAANVELLLSEITPSVVDLRLSACDLQSAETWFALVPPNLKQLTLRDVGVSETPLFLAVLERLHALTDLDLSDNYFTGSLAAAFGSLPLLKSLVLNGNCLGSEGLLTLSTALPRLPQLETLGLSRTCAEGPGLEAVLRVLARSAVRKLDLSYNSLRRGGWTTALAVLPVLLRLETLDIGGNCLEDRELLLFCQCAEVLPRLRTLCTADNFPSPETERRLRVLTSL